LFSFKQLEDSKEDKFEESKEELEEVSFKLETKEALLPSS
jgi:exonuclease VII small subunit